MTSDYDEKASSDAAAAADEEALHELTVQLSKFNWKDGVVDRAKHLLYSSDLQDNVKGVLNLKAMLCIGREEVYEVAQEVIDSGVISRLIYFLTVNHRELQWPSAFCLTNIAAGHDAQTQIVVEAGAIPPLISFLRHQDAQLRRQAIFCLANVAGSTQEYRKMLATHPDYFSSMFCAGSMSSDARVLELVCWNLRNVCFLGGPTFQETKPGVEYLLNSILKRYLHFQYWSGCVRYALETVTAVCRTDEGRQFMIEEELMPCLLSLIENISLTSYSISQATFEACAWLLAFGTPMEKQLFVQKFHGISNSINQAIQGQFGDAAQELALKCLVFIALDTDREWLLFILESDESLIQTSAQLYFGMQSGNGQSAGKSSSLDASSPAASAGAGNHINGGQPSSQILRAHVKEYAACLIIKCLVISRLIFALRAKLLVSNSVIKAIIDIFEFAAEQLRGKQYGQNLLVNGSFKQPEQEAPSGSISSIGPSIPCLDESLTVSALIALTEYIQEGEDMKVVEELFQNPIVLMCYENDVPNRLRQILNTTVLSEKAFALGNKLIQKWFVDVPSSSGQFTLA